MLKLRSACAVLLGALVLSGGAEAAPRAVPVTFLHTNDLHSHFRAERTALGLGGVARLKTAMDRVRAQVPYSLTLDGGDWSEGNAYYMLGTGRETLRMMDSMGYDVAVVGNHDWLNGPDVLLDAYEQARTRLQLVAANVDLDNYRQADRFRRLIPPYVIREVGGVKIAFIGVVTYEKIFDRYLKPVDIREPFIPVARLASQLKSQVDAVVAISHNTIVSNRMLLQAARDVDLVIGAHDHVKLTEPVVVNRPGGTTAWIVETGSWGRYLGRVDVTIEPRNPRVEGSKGTVSLLRYGLTQMDASIPEDLATLTRITQLETQLEALYRAPIFHDHVADVEEDFDRDGSEPMMGNLAVDAYRAATGADVAFDMIQFVYGGIHPGAIRTVDVLNAAPGIYNPVTGKSWTVHTLPLTGSAIEKLLKVFFSTTFAANDLGITTSGVQMVYNPFSEGGLQLPMGLTLPDFAGLRDHDGAVVRDLKIGGVPFDPRKRYLAAFSGGVLEAFQFLNQTGIEVIPMGELRDTGRESWRTILEYLNKNSPVLPGFIKLGQRARTLTPDLAVPPQQVRSRVKGLNALGQLVVHVDVTVSNFGATTAPRGARLALMTALEGANTAVRPTMFPVANPIALPEIPPGDSVTHSFDLTLRSGGLGLFRLDVAVDGNPAEVVHSNDQATVWLKAN